MKKRQFDYDVLRIFSAYFVILIHVVMNFWSLELSGIEFQIPNIYNSISRVCVPIFFMISGALMLNTKKNIDIKDLYFRKILRLCLCLGFWAWIYLSIKYCVGENEIRFSIFIDAMREVLKGNTYFHLWFLYQMIGIYMVVPILTSWVKKSDKKTLEYFLILCFAVTSILPTMMTLGIFQRFQILSLIHVPMIGSYIGYFILGYYLVKYPISKDKTKWIYRIGMLSLLATIIGTTVMTMRRHVIFEGLIAYYSPTVVFASIAFFVWAQKHFHKVNWKDRTKKMVVSFSNLTFGIYLVHMLFLEGLPTTKLLSLPWWQNIFVIPLYTLMCFLLSALVSWLLSKIPVVRKWLV